MLPGSDESWVRVSREYAGRRRATPGNEGDRGFTLLEVVVSVAVITIVLTGLSTFFVQAMSASNVQGRQQAGVRLAADSMGTLRATEVSALLAGRAACAPACPVPVADAASLLAGTERWDAAATSVTSTASSATSGTGFAVPPMSTAIDVNGVLYQRYLYLGRCWEQTGGGPCTPTSTLPVAMVRAVVAMTWPSPSCAQGTCAFATSTLISAGESGDPVFSSQDVGVTAIDDRVDTAGSAVSSMQPVATGGTNPYTWTVTGLPSGVTFDPIKNLAAGTATTAGASTVTVTVTDARGRTAKATFTWTIVTKLTLAAVADQGTTQGRGVTLSPTAAGGSTPYSWSATGLPNGLSINSGTGVITGTPNTLGASIVTVTVTDVRQQTATASFVWTIYSAPKLTVPVKQDTYLGTLADPLQMSATDGVGPYTWTAANLRSGMTINSKTGLISGTPAALGTAHCVVTVTDSRGETAVVNFDWSIDKAQRLNDSSSTQLLVANASLYTWSTVNMPPGLTINSLTGLVTGTPTVAGTWDIQIVLTTADGTVKSIPFKWTIYAPLTVAVPSTQSSKKGTAIPPLQLTQTGGAGPFTWTASGLPAGLSIDPDSGQITGTPTTTGTKTVTVTVTDYAANTKSVTFTWGVS